jgi:hypothetical protein
MHLGRIGKWPQKFAATIPWFGALMLVEGCILFHGMRHSFPPFPFYGDTLTCFVGGGGIMWLSVGKHSLPNTRTS